VLSAENFVSETKGEKTTILGETTENNDAIDHRHPPAIDGV
jgi:hypothetical protein